MESVGYHQNVSTIIAAAAAVIVEDIHGCVERNQWWRLRRRHSALLCRWIDAIKRCGCSALVSAASSRITHPIPTHVAARSNTTPPTTHGFKYKPV